MSLWYRTVIQDNKVLFHSLFGGPLMSLEDVAQEALERRYTSVIINGKDYSIDHLLDITTKPQKEIK